MSQVEEFRRIPVAALTFSQTTAQKERRAHFNKVALTELAGTVKEHGVVEPILVRPMADGKFEVIAGERRVLATKEVGLIDVPAIIRDISDEQLLKFQLIENLQREGLSELAEAEGYEQLMKKFGLTAEMIIEQVGKSRSYVYGRLRLSALCKDGRDAFYEGLLNASTALDLAKIPVESLQKQAVKEVTKPMGGGPPMSVREARDHIQKHYMLRLNGVGFEPEDATLVPKAGACGPCHKRTGNNQDLFGDVKGTDVCTDTVCFKLKVAAHAARLIEDAKKTGQKVIAGAAAIKKIAPYGLDSSYLAGYVRLDETSHDHGNKKYSVVLGKDYVPTLLQNPDTGAVIKVAPRGDIPKPKPEKGASTGGRSTASRKEAAKDNAKEQQKKELEKMSRVAVFRAVLAAAPKKVDRETLQDIVIRELVEGVCVGDESFFELMGWKAGTEPDVAKAIKALPEGELAQLTAVMAAAEDAIFGYSNSDALKAAAKRYGVNVDKIRARVAAEMKAPAKAAGPAPAGPAGKSKAKAKGSPAKKTSAKKTSAKKK